MSTSLSDLSYGDDDNVVEGSSKVGYAAEARMNDWA
jgi:hypothetical protein